MYLISECFSERLIEGDANSAANRRPGPAFMLGRARDQLLDRGEFFNHGLFGLIIYYRFSTAALGIVRRFDAIRVHFFDGFGVLNHKIGVSAFSIVYFIIVIVIQEFGLSAQRFNRLGSDILTKLTDLFGIVFIRQLFPDR